MSHAETRSPNLIRSSAALVAIALAGAAAGSVPAHASSALDQYSEAIPTVDGEHRSTRDAGATETGSTGATGAGAPITGEAASTTAAGSGAKDSAGTGPKGKLRIVEGAGAGGESDPLLRAVGRSASAGGAGSTPAGWIFAAMAVSLVGALFARRRNWGAVSDE